MTRGDFVVSAMLIMGAATMVTMMVIALAGASGGGRPSNPIQVGYASWYGEAHRGNKTASGEIFNPDMLTAAHRTLPLGASVRVVRPDKRLSVTVRINDRGPYVDGRVIDLSEAAAGELEMIDDGTAYVELYND